MGFEQILATAENFRPGVLGDDQSLHAAEDAVNGELIFAEAVFEFAELAPRFSVARRGDAQHLAALQLRVEQLAEAVGVLTQQTAISGLISSPTSSELAFLAIRWVSITI